MGLKYLKTKLFIIAIVAVMSIGSVDAKDFYKMSSINLPTAFAVNTTFAKIVMKYNKDIEFQINSTGTAPRHALDAANGKIDFFFSAPSLSFLMSKGKAMFKKVKNAPELSKNIRMVFQYRMGTYNFGVYGDSGIKTMFDIKGKRAFIGPPTGVMKIVSSGFIKAVTGYEMNKDYTAVKLGFTAAKQAFQDRQIDMMTDGGNHPSSFFSQIALTNKIRFLGAADDVDWGSKNMKNQLKRSGFTKGSIAPDIYGKNQTNTKPTQTLASFVGLYTRKGIPKNVIYKMTKTFWEHIDEMHSVTAWAKDAITTDAILSEANTTIHAGALKYYKEIGLKIPANLQ
jgi:TRAP transporter TAXI family solute receptor